MKSSFKFFASLAIFIILFPVSELRSQTLSFKNFTVNEGLPSSTIYASFQDSKGFMWFASDLGVSKYDGYSFTNFTSNDGLTDNEIFNFFEDHQKRMWLSSLNGKVTYRKEGRFVNSSVDTILSRLDSESSICAMFESRAGTVWLCTYKDGIIAYTKEGTVHRFFDQKEFVIINGFIPLTETRILIIGRYGLFEVQFSNDLDSVVDVRKVEFSLDNAFSFSKCLAVNNNEILFTDKGTIYSGDLINNRYGIFMKEKSDSLVIYNLCKDDEFVWICTNGGAIPYSTKSRTFGKPVMSDYKVSSVLKDREGNYWISTLGDGIFFRSFGAMYSVTAKDGLPSAKVTCVTKDSLQRIWVGYEKGIVSVIQKGRIESKIISHKRFLNSCHVRKIFVSGNRTWVASSIGLSLLENNKLQFLSGNVREVIEFPGNHLWLASSARVFTMTRNVFNKFKNEMGTDPDNYKSGYADLGSLKVERSKAFFLDKNSNVWIATEKHVYKGRNDSLQYVDPDRFNGRIQINDFDQLPDSTMVAATSGNGIIFFKNDRYRTITDKDGLSSNTCNAIACDGNTIWVATNKGLNKVTGYPDNIEVEYFNLYDGLLSNETLDVTVCGDTVWVATQNGLNFFYKDYLKRSRLVPEVLIESMQVHDRVISPDSMRQQIAFAHNLNDIKINFICPLYNSIGAVSYRYKLHPYDAWQYTKSPYVYLLALQPDNYEFIVQAKGRPGIWSNEASISFVIEKPFYRTNLFIALLLVLIISITVTIVLIYLKAQRAKAAMKHRVVVSELQTLRAQMNPHFVFNALNSIQDLFLKNNTGVAQTYIAKFARLMRSLLDYSNNGTITVSEEIATLTNYLEIEQLRMGGRFTYNIEIHESIDIHTTEMPSMILQPFVENSIWHGFSEMVENPRLTIRFDLDGGDYMVIILSDNGIGRRKSAMLKNKKHDSKGIKLILERIDILNFGNARKISLSIHDLEDESGNNPGTLVKVKIPLDV